MIAPTFSHIGHCVQVPYITGSGFYSIQVSTVSGGDVTNLIPDDRLEPTGSYAELMTVRGTRYRVSRYR